MNEPLKGFITYSHEDTEAKHELRKRLAVMEQQNELMTWDDGQLTPGDGALQEDILKNVADSDLLLYLVSAASLASKNCNRELAEAIEGDKRVIPIILEHCDWLRHQLSGFEVLPHKGKPITDWKTAAEGWQNVVEGIRKVVDKIKSEASASPGTSEKELRAEMAFQYGHVLFLLGQLDRAMEAYSSAINLNPRNASAYNNRGIVYADKGDLDNAIEHYNTAIKLKPDYAEAYYNRGNAYDNKGEVDNAIRDYTEAIKRNPDFVEAYSNRGTVYLNKHDVNNAIRDYTEAIKRNPDQAEVYYNRGIAYANKGDLDNAIRDYTEAIKRNPDFVEAYSNRGTAYYNKGDFDNAIRDHTEAIKHRPDLVEAYNNRGNAYAKKGGFEKAIRDHTEAIKLNPELAGAYNNRGTAYAKNSELDNAINDYNRSIRLNPKLAEAYYNRGTVYADKGDFEKAVRDHTEAVKLNPEFAGAYNNRGNAYAKKGELDNAIKNFEKAIQLQPDDVNAHCNLGNAYADKGELDNAIKNFEKAIQRKPDYAKAYYGRGNAYAKKGELDNAISDYNAAIQRKPDYAEAYYNRGTAYAHKGEFDNIIRDYNTAIQLKPDYAEAYNNRGNVYKIKGKVELAIKDYTKAIELNAEFPQPYYNRGVAQIRLKEWEKTKSDLITAKKIGLDIVALFHNEYKGVERFEKRFGFKLPEDIAHLLTERLRTRYPKTRSVLDADGNPLESPTVVNLRAQLRDAGTSLGEYLKAKPSFGINTSPTEAFVVDKATRDKLIAEHPSSADILKPFLDGKDLRRWYIDTPQQWLIYTHRRIAIKEYPAILNHLEKYREVLRKRKGNQQKWYELQASLRDTERFAQPKLVCPDTYNHQAFAVDTAGYYYGKTAYLIPTEETWLCGLLNSGIVEWLYSQVSKQLTIDPLRARSRYIQQIPIPDLTSTQKALIAKIVDYLIYLQQQPTTDSKDLAHARDAVMLGYFERVIDGLVYEAYLPEDLHKGDKHFFQPLLEEQLPLCEEIQGDKMPALRALFERLYERTHPIRRNLFFLDSVKPVRVIQGKL